MSKEIKVPAGFVPVLDPAGKLTAYYINRKGDVWTAHRQRLMKPQRGTAGYPVVALTINGKFRTYETHRLLAEAFILNPHNHPLVRHLNDDKDDLRLENLAWGTYKDNYHDALRNGSAMGRKPKLSAEEAADVWDRWHKGETQRELAEAYNVSPSTVNRYIAYVAEILKSSAQLSLLS